MSKIIISRPFEWLNQTASNNIYIDGKKVGTITPGETIHYDVMPGKHIVETKSLWSGGSHPIKVEVGSGENKVVELTGYKYIIFIPLIIGPIIGSLNHLAESLFNIEINTYHIIFGFLFVNLLYFFVIGRNTYWKMEEVE